MSKVRSEEFDATHAYFIGPKGDNLPDFRANINTILDELLVARQSYYPEDQAFISREIRRSEKFLKARSNLRLATEKVAQLLGEHSAPFWSPRYEAHMCTDLTMSSMLGYFMTMLYNPNNVAVEGSPMTTLVELRVGKQLSKLFGYNIDEHKFPLSWGHITSGGSVANLESIWVARNLKFYPLSLSLALNRGKLQFVAEKFYATSNHGPSKRLFKDMDGWELLNLSPETVLDLPNELNKQFGITGKFLESALKDYNIQTIGREALEKEFKVKSTPKYFLSKTRHYSWPKGAAIAGIGSGNMIGIDVNYAAQLDIEVLEEKLRSCVETKTPVYAVVAVIGSTEEGAVDRLTEILRLRKSFQEQHGLSFLVHADACWGGYFKTMINPNKQYSVSEQSGTKPEPEWYLDPKTVEDLESLSEADSISVDPHKAGYIPYPAGSLVYRDGRMRNLVTWSGPYLSQGSVENMGVFGVEGSKPGAAAMSAWFSNQTIGLNHLGYGKLLGEATFTSARLSAHYAVMINEDFMCIPFQMLPAEKHNKCSFLSEPVENQRQRIRELIIGKEDHEIFESPDAMNLIRDLRSDLNINAFALNWKFEDGTINTDLDEANYLMKRVIDRLSITSPNTDPSTIPILLTSTQFSHEDYGSCAQRFMERMGVGKSTESLFVLRNVVMSPFPARKSFIVRLMADLEEVIRQEVQVCRKRNKAGSKPMQFLVQGSPSGSEVFLVSQASFHSISRQQQTVLSATLDKGLRDYYEELWKGSQDTIVIVESDGIFDSNKISVMMYQKGLRSGLVPEEIGGHTLTKHGRNDHKKGFISINSLVKRRSLSSINRDSKYPDTFMPFYLYGTEQEMHISHILTKSPNVSLSASNVTFNPSLSETSNGGEITELLSVGLILGLTEVPEDSMQPFVKQNKDLPDDFFFGQKKRFQVKVWKDPRGSEEAGPGLLWNLEEHLYQGEITLEGDVFVDVEGPNADEFDQGKIESDCWQKKLDEIGNILCGSNDNKH